MTILVADDHDLNRKLLSAVLTAEGYNVEVARDGGEALAILTATTEPLVALIDWQMPVQTGPEVCRSARQGTNANLLFLILLTARGSTQDIVSGLASGANDFVTKPFEEAELLARVRVGVKVVELQQSLARRVRELEAAMVEIKQLSGLLPICAYCKKIRDDKNYWQQVEGYISAHTNAKFSHGICPECFTQHVRPQLEAIGMSKAEIDKARPGPPPIPTS